MILLTSFSDRMQVVILAVAILFAAEGCTAGTTVVPGNTARPGSGLKVAVLPVENLSGLPYPVKAIRQMLVSGLVDEGVDVLDETRLREFMTRHRVRYTGGVDNMLARAFREDEAVDAVLVTSLFFSSEGDPPKIAYAMRLVAIENTPVPLWIDDVSLSGSESPGFLGLGLVRNADRLRGMANARMMESFRLFRSGTNRSFGGKGTADQEAGDWKRRKFQPKIIYRSPEIDFEVQKYRIAVIPLRNFSTWKNAGDIMALLLARHLATRQNFEVVEPGVVRQALLTARVTMGGGLTLPQTEILFNMLDADLIVTGDVMDFQEPAGGSGNPKVDFAVRVFDGKRREVVFSSGSYASGEDGVFFFDFGKVYTAHRLADEMANAVVGRLRNKAAVPPAKYVEEMERP